MALLFADSCGDNYDTTTAELFWLSFTGGAPIVTAGRNGNGLSSSSGSGYVRAPNISVPSDGVTSIVVGAAFLLVSAPTSPVQLLTLDQWFGDGPYVGADGSVGYSETTLTPAPAGTFEFGVWNYVETKVTYNGSTGVENITVQLNESPCISGSYSRGNLSGNLTGVGIYYDTNTTVDDVYISDSTGAAANDFAGDVEVVVMMPNAEGRVDVWNPRGAPSNHQCVNEVPPDFDSTFVFDPTPGDEDCYALQNPPGIGAVYGVQITAVARQEDVPREIALGIGDGTSEVFGSAQTLGSSYAAKSTQFSSNPLSAAAWSTSDLVTLQAAINVTS